eukprot:TRINITY_DN14289_c0_g1_i10.p1 TRINITY_DN14289_c0_g1~~TRINITY_DN14289_c0_g1_i10.p1  ORF type:complete len:277 (-),score=57.99 TRINITY_DN14289_c0_g1_i10:135-965(-)
MFANYSMYSPYCAQYTIFPSYLPAASPYPCYSFVLVQPQSYACNSGFCLPPQTNCADPPLCESSSSQAIDSEQAVSKIEQKESNAERSSEKDGEGKKRKRRSLERGKEKMKLGRWLKDEKERFVEALKLYGKNWIKVAKHVRTRIRSQIRSHAQKYFLKLEGSNGTKPKPSLAAKENSGSEKQNPLTDPQLQENPANIRLVSDNKSNTSCIFPHKLFGRTKEAKVQGSVECRKLFELAKAREDCGSLGKCEEPLTNSAFNGKGAERLKLLKDLIKS